MVHRSPNSHPLKTRALIGFSSQTESNEMQRWIAASGIVMRLAPPKYTGPMLSVAGGKPS